MKTRVWKRTLAGILSALLCLSLTGCGGGAGEGDAVSVQSVAMLMGVDTTGNNRFSGVTEAKSTQKVQKDGDKTVAECLVDVGDVVKKGDVLFRYDTESLRLSVESAELEVEQIQNSITSYASQINDLERERKSAAKGDKLSYTLQIQEIQIDKAEAEYNLKQKQGELEKLKKSVGSTEVKSEVSGVIRSINEDSVSAGNGESGEGGEDDSAYITIMETGTYRVKGTANEMNVGELYEGLEVTVLSRVDATQTWRGTVSEVITNSSASEEGTGDTPAYYEGDEGESETSTKYNFYVTLENSDGLMMGQHVYIAPGTIPTAGSGLTIPAWAVVQEDDSAYVWAEGKNGTLEKRAVTLGAYDEAAEVYAVQDGLTLEDYVAYPDPGLSEGDAVTRYTEGGEGDSSALPEEDLPQDDLSGEGLSEEGLAGEDVTGDLPERDTTDSGAELEAVNGADMEG